MCSHGCSVFPIVTRAAAGPAVIDPLDCLSPRPCRREVDCTRVRALILFLFLLAEQKHEGTRAFSASVRWPKCRYLRMDRRTKTATFRTRFAHEARVSQQILVSTFAHAGEELAANTGSRICAWTLDCVSGAETRGHACLFCVGSMGEMPTFWHVPTAQNRHV